MCPDSDSKASWDGEHCPFCGSPDIALIGNTIGQDTGDDGCDYDSWVCDHCNEAWLEERP